jgi:rhodanese-related sulfurtransferase
LKDDEGGLPEVTATELNQRLQAEQPLTLVDVREPYEKQIADLPEVGQLRIPMGELGMRLEDLAAIEGPVILYCRSGSRSGRATIALRARGFDNIWNLKGGLLAWKDEVDPSIQEY